MVRNGDRKGLLLKQKKGGMFLNEAIRLLEETYGKGQIPRRIQLCIIIGILESLKALHSGNGKEGYLHLDLHPGNLFLENVTKKDLLLGEVSPNVCFLDFSEARKIHHMDAQTEEISYTAGYAAPELVSRPTRHVGM